jgi:hypothetical protein
MIGFIGVAGSGKTTLANMTATYLMERDRSAISCSFADPIRALYAAGGRHSASEPTASRHFYQEVGAAARRVFPDFFCQPIRNHFNAGGHHYTSKDVAIFDDVRYENECSTLRRLDPDALLVFLFDGQSVCRTKTHAHESEELAHQLHSTFCNTGRGVLRLPKIGPVESVDVSSPDPLESFENLKPLLARFLPLSTQYLSLTADEETEDSEAPSQG